LKWVGSTLEPGLIAFTWKLIRVPIQVRIQVRIACKHGYSLRFGLEPQPVAMAGLEPQPVAMAGLEPQPVAMAGLGVCLQH
jgi:hypothetical protein